MLGISSIRSHRKCHWVDFRAGPVAPCIIGSPTVACKRGCSIAGRRGGTDMVADVRAWIPVGDAYGGASSRKGMWRGHELRDGGLWTHVI